MTTQCEYHIANSCRVKIASQFLIYFSENLEIGQFENKGFLHSDIDRLQNKFSPPKKSCFTGARLFMSTTSTIFNIILFFWVRGANFTFGQTTCKFGDEEEEEKLITVISVFFCVSQDR
jgi:hypothetical protein